MLIAASIMVDMPLARSRHGTARKKDCAMARHKKIDPAVLHDERFLALYEKRFAKPAWTVFPSWPYDPKFQREHEVRRVRRSAGKNRKKLLAALKNERENKCVDCGSENNLTVDHVLPVTYGGTNDLFNLQLFCKKCNSGIGNSLPVFSEQQEGE